MMAEGGSSPILGEKIYLPPTGEYGASGTDARGFGVFPYDSVYRSEQAGILQKTVATRRKLNPLLSGSQEWVWGYSSSNIGVDSRIAGDECWETRENLNGKPLGADGWCKGRILASSMRLEPWSAPVSFRRWLEG
jgi:hypothetical protein